MIDEVVEPATIADGPNNEDVPFRRRGKDKKKRPSQSRVAVAEREAFAAAMLAQRMNHARITEELVNRFGLSLRGAQATVSRVYRNAWEAVESFKDTFASFGPNSILAGIMIEHAMSLRRSIELCIDCVKAGDSSALMPLEKLQRQYAELWGLLTRGPTVSVGNSDGCPLKTIVATKYESKAKSVLARLTGMTTKDLDTYVMSNLPGNEASPDEATKL